MKQERPGMMHLKKVTKTVDYYSYGLSSDARSRCSEARRPQLSAAGAPGRCPGLGPLGKGTPQKGLAHLPTQSREGGRGRGRGGPREGRAAAPRADPRDLRAKASCLGAGEAQPPNAWVSVIRNSEQRLSPRRAFRRKRLEISV